MNACLDFLRNLDKKCVHYNNFQKNLKSSNNKLNIVLVQLSVKQYTDHRLGKCVLYKFAYKTRNRCIYCLGCVYNEDIDLVRYTSDLICQVPY